MGGVKDAWIKEQEQGWISCSDKAVCAKCFDDPAIAAFVREGADKPRCSYCKRFSRSRSIALDMNEVIPFILAGLSQEWGDPNNEGVVYESAEGGWQGIVIDSYDLLHWHVDTSAGSSELLNDLVAAFADRQWCQRDFYRLLPHRELSFSWGQFSERVKHHTRYVFFRAEDAEDDEKPSHAILDDLGKIVQELGIVQSLAVGTTVYRARIHSARERPRTIRELGPPPRELARVANRMSPPGIPLFYGGLDSRTALAEVRAASRQRTQAVSLATFETLKTMRVVDFTSIPQIPSIFDERLRVERAAIIFLNEFVQSMSRPIERDGGEHIEYVPTQVITEYFRYLFRSPDLVQGLIYRSSVAQGSACVLFVDPAAEPGEFAGPNDIDKWLRLVRVRSSRNKARSKKKITRSITDGSRREI